MMSAYSISLFSPLPFVFLVSPTLQSVHGCDLALTTLVGASNNCDLVVFADGDGADVVLFAEFLGQLVRN
jgi:hypothetical protein